MNPAIFLDRDGTINVDREYLCSIGECEYLDGVIEALRELNQMGFKLIIVTNQSGIARGYFTESDYLQFMNWMIADLKDKGISIDGQYYCPHLPGATVKKYDMICACRKPATELYFRAIKEKNIDIDHSFAVGDRLRDLEICKGTKIRGILLKKNREYVETDFPYVICSNWIETLNYIKREVLKQGE